MYQEEIAALSQTAKKKLNLLEENPLGYFFSAMLAGMFVGFAVILAFTIGGQMGGAPQTKILMGVSFGIALSLVVIAGGDLFTGNNMVMALGTMNKTVTLGQSVKLWIVCWLGNWAGSALLGVIFWAGGYATGPVGEFFANGAAGKMAISFFPLVMRGVLCNILVCLAVWSAARCKSESGKLIMIFWCLYAFITSGFEHSVANMTLFTITLLSPMDAAVSFSGACYNLFAVTLGNMIGGIFIVALPYQIISRKK